MNIHKLYSRNIRVSGHPCTESRVVKLTLTECQIRLYGNRRGCAGVPEGAVGPARLPRIHPSYASPFPS